MPTHLIEKAQTALKYWWLLLLVGIFFIIGGFWIMQRPLASYVALSIMFAAFMFVSGLFELIFAISNRKEIENWGWQLTGAIFDFAIGTVLILFPGLTMQVLPLLVAFFFMFRGFFGVSLAIDMQKNGTQNWGWMLVASILAIVFSMLVIFNPALGGLTIVFYTAMAFIMLGLFKIFAALQMRRFKSKAGDLRERIEAKLA